jgi:hypothetical protein
MPPHSLGKLIEWKQNAAASIKLVFVSPLAGETNWMEMRLHPVSAESLLVAPHSLGKLIEWKRDTREVPFCNEGADLLSPLAGETNWIKARIAFRVAVRFFLFSFAKKVIEERFDF